MSCLFSCSYYMPQSYTSTEQHIHLFFYHYFTAIFFRVQPHSFGMPLANISLFNQFLERLCENLGFAYFMSFR